MAVYERQRRESPALPRGNFVAAIFFDPDVRRRATWSLGLLTLLFVLIVGAFTAFGSPVPFDRPLTNATQPLDDNYPLVASFFEVVGFLGYSPWNAVAGAVIGIALALWLGWQVMLLFTGITLVQGLVGILLKFPITVERPMETELNAPIDIIKASSFPSGHTSMYIVMFGFPVYLLWRHGAPRWLSWLATILYGILVLFVGPARVSLGAHWWSDVIGGVLLGFFVLLLGIELYERWLLPRMAEE